jgi:hypothetical protein
VWTQKSTGDCVLLYVQCNGWQEWWSQDVRDQTSQSLGTHPFACLMDHKSRKLLRRTCDIFGWKENAGFDLKDISYYHWIRWGAAMTLFRIILWLFSWGISCRKSTQAARWPKIQSQSCKWLQST